MSSNVGAIKGKKDLIDVIEDNIIPLTAIALIHRIGLKKYKMFSWYNDPYQTDGSVRHNLNAILRHFSAHRSGCTIDPESGLPHIFHMACRCGMAVTVYYKQQLQPKNKINPDRLFITPWSLGMLLTGEELISLSKFNPVVPENRVTIDELAVNINNILYSIILDGDITSAGDDLLNDVNSLDSLFSNICDYVKKVWTTTNLKESVNIDVIPKHYYSILGLDHEMNQTLYRRFMNVN